jgi:hypothetical protein
MTKKHQYECEVCGAHVDADSSDAPPNCCDRPMKAAEPLPVCETSETAEHSRMDDHGEPCDDGRAGKL